MTKLVRRKLRHFAVLFIANSTLDVAVVKMKISAEFGRKNYLRRKAIIFQNRNLNFQQQNYFEKLLIFILKLSLKKENASSRLVRFENKINVFYFEKALLPTYYYIRWRCSCKFYVPK
jgi:hypothetical protein